MAEFTKDYTYVVPHDKPEWLDMMLDRANSMYQRDKNHPCVIIWSVANEPASQEDGAKEYFEPLLNLVRELDEQKRPATLVTYEGSNPVSCKVAEICDLLIINRYRGWYDTEGNLRGAAALLKDELEGFHKRCPDKPHHMPAGNQPDTLR